MSVRALTATVLVALTVAACGSNGAPPDAASARSVPASTAQGASTTEPSETVAASGQEPTTAVAATPSSLQFNVPLVGGGELDGSTLAGRPVAFWFWAPT